MIYKISQAIGRFFSNNTRPKKTTIAAATAASSQSGGRLTVLGACVINWWLFNCYVEALLESQIGQEVGPGLLPNTSIAIR